MVQDENRIGQDRNSHAGNLVALGFAKTSVIAIQDDANVEPLFCFVSHQSSQSAVPSQSSQCPPSSPSPCSSSSSMSSSSSSSSLLGLESVQAPPPPPQQQGLMGAPECLHGESTWSTVGQHGMAQDRAGQD